MSSQQVWFRKGEVWLTQVEPLPALVVRHEDSSLWRLTAHQRLNAISNRIKLKVKITHSVQ